MPIEPSTFDSNGAMNEEMFHVKQLLRRREKGADAPGGHATGLPDDARVSPTGFSLGETSTCQHWTSVRCVGEPESRALPWASALGSQAEVRFGD